MLHVAKTLTFGMLVGTLLLVGSAQAQTTTTTSTSTSTTTTLLPHPWSPATQECLQAARREFRHCPSAHDVCFMQYQVAFEQCFAAGSGVKCATKCEASLSKCLTAVPTTKSKCLSTCRTNRYHDTQACKRIALGEGIWTGGDQGCLITKDLTYALCKFQCSEATAVCHTNFKFCIANCENQ